MRRGFNMYAEDLCKLIKIYDNVEINRTTIEYIIRAFSEYICAVDNEYLYNKTFLNEYIDSFVNSTCMLQKKRNLLESFIKGFNLHKDSIFIDIDSAWTYDGRIKENDKAINLHCNFDKWKVNSNIASYQIRYLGTHDLVIAGVIDIKNKDKKIEEIFNLFEDRLKM